MISKSHTLDKSKEYQEEREFIPNKWATKPIQNPFFLGHFLLVREYVIGNNILQEHLLQREL